MNAKFFITLAAIFKLQTTAFANIYEFQQLLYAPSPELVEKVFFSTERTPTVNKLIREFYNCGFSASNFGCLDSSFNSGQGTLVKYRNEIVILKALSTQMNDEFFVMATHYHSNNADKPIYVSILRAEDNRNRWNLEEAYKEGELKRILRATIPKSVVKKVETKLNSPKNIKDIFHATNILISKKQSLGIIQDAISNNLEIIKKTSEGKYPIALLKLLEKVSEISDSVKSELANHYITLNDKNLREYSAIILANLGEDTPIVKQNLASALESSNWEIRKSALNAINKIQSGLEDEILILKRIGDADSDIQKIAITLVQNINLSSLHIETLNAISTSSDWKVRQYAIRHLSRVSGSKVTEILIQRLKDSDSDVRKTVTELLNSRKIGTAHLPTLSSLSHESSWEIRKLAVHFIGKLSTPQAVNQLIAKISDSDTDVRNAAASLLARKNITMENFEEITKLSTASDWKVREIGAGLLSRIPSEESKHRLIRMLTDNDSDVKNKVISYLNNRQLNANDVPLLKDILASNDWQTRRHAARYLGATNSEEAKSVLVQRLLIESDSDVKKAIADAFNRL